MTDNQLIRILQTCPIFREVSADRLSYILGTISYKLVDFNGKDIYLLAGMPCKYADIILTGEMVARMTGFSGKMVQIDRLGPGTIVAPAFIFANKKEMPVSVETVTATTVFRMLPSEMRKLIDNFEDIRMNFITQLSNIDVFLSQKLRVLSLLTVREKVAYFLLKAAESQQSRTITIDKTRQEIAESFGIQKFSLLRCFAEFVENGAIEIDGKQIKILDANKLK